MRKLLFPLAISLTLLSCGGKPELREDIKEFISQFSIEVAMNTYKTGGYISTVEEITAEKKTKKVIEMEFSYVDSSHPTYVETTTQYEDDVVKSVTEIEFVEIEEKYYISRNGELTESTLQRCSELIRDFFYKKVELDGQYHVQGWYYGDLIKNVAPVMQEYITIDQDQELYILDYTKTDVLDGLETNLHQDYSVNKYGMLVENHVSASNAQVTKTTDVIVHN